MLKEAFNSVFDLVMPRVCVVCGRTLLKEERNICLVCLEDLPLTHFEFCPHNPMADMFNARIDASSYAWATALFHYVSGSGYDLITQSVKYHSDLSAGRRFGEMLGGRIAAASWAADVDAVVPVPLHWTRRWKRGYNQAEVIAEGLCRELNRLRMGCPVTMRTDILKRVRRTRTQLSVGPDSRGANVEKAFCVKQKAASGPAPVHILLIDDVFTSGSTLAACQKALRDVWGDKVRVSAATLGFASE